MPRALAFGGVLRLTMWSPAEVCRPTSRRISTTESPRCARLDTRLILDTSGGGLQHLTGGKVFLLKPSVRELRECVGRELPGEAQQLAAARELMERGCARNVLVSLGAEAALFVTAQGAQRYPAVAVPPGSGVGAAMPWSPGSPSP